MNATLREAFRALRVRLALLLARGTVEGVDDTRDLRLLQLRVQGQPHDGVPQLEPYGFNAVPLDGARAAALFPAGQREAGVAVVVVDGRHRPKGWARGECGLYTDEGTVLHAQRGRVLRVEQATLEIVVDTLTIQAGGSTITVSAAGVEITAPTFVVNSPSVDFNP